MKAQESNIILAGVGGQGTILAAEVLGVAAIEDELNVRVGEIHGMAQRGGAVISTVRIGPTVETAVILDGQADLLIGFEPLETIRNLKYASEKTCIIINEQPILPTELATTKKDYPTMAEIRKKISMFTDKVVALNAALLAEKAGNSLAQNSVLIGAADGLRKLPLRTDSLVEALRKLVPPNQVEINLRAFNLGQEAARSGNHATKACSGR